MFLGYPGHTGEPLKRNRQDAHVSIAFDMISSRHILFFQQSLPFCFLRFASSVV